MKPLLYILLAFVGITGCYTVKDAVKQTHRAKDNYPDTIAAVLRAWKPCIVTYKDTLRKTDTLTDIISVECPGDTLWLTDTLETSYVVRDPKIIKVPLPRIRETVTITNNIRDMADATACESKRIVTEKKLAQANGWVKILGVASGLLLILFLLTLFVFRKK